MSRIALAMLVLLLPLLALASPASAAFEFVQEWGTLGSGDGQFRQPQDVAVAPDGSVYVADSINHRIQKFGSDGTFVTKWGASGSGNGQFSSPFGLAVDSAGNVYVADRNNHRIQKFTPAGSFTGAFGSFGTGDGQFNAPVDVAVDGAGNMYVLEYSNNRVQKLSPSGAFVTKWGSRGTGDGQFELPSHIAVDPAGDVYVSEPSNNRVQKFSPTGSLITKWGSAGTGDGQFGGVQGIAADASGNIFAVDFNGRRVQKFTGSGAFLGTFGSIGTGPGQFTRPDGIAVHPTAGIYVTDGGANSIERFRETPEGPAGPPPPQVGKTANIEVIKGTVTYTPKGSRTAVPLTGAIQVPVGSRVNTMRGTVRLTTARDTKGLTQTGDFYNGVFQVTQRRSSRPITELRLQGGSFRGCSARRSGVDAAQSRRRVRRLWGNARGRFRSKGRYSSATVRGTIWLTEDRCDGTLTRVRQGVVTVRDLVRRRNITLRARRSYLARPRR